MFNYVKNVQLTIIIMVIMIFVSGCGFNNGTNTLTSKKSVVDNYYKVLKTTKIAYTNAMKTVAMMYKQGKISEKTKAKSIIMGKEFVSAYKILARSLEMYANGVNSPITIEQATSNFVEINMKLMNFVREVTYNE